MDTLNNRSREPRLGLLTTTITPSAVVRWILHARIRRRRFNDVVFVGDDFISVKQVLSHGHLGHVATKRDFDCRIRAAKVFSNEAPPPEEDIFIKYEDNEPQEEDSIPPQCIVLTLDSNDLLFICMVAVGTREWRFKHQACPMPTFDRTLFQPGEHLAVDPGSRALAVAANEQEVVIYSAKSKERIQRELRTNDQKWCPVAAQRPLQVEGVIQHVDFLIPPSDDEDHIILLLILMDEQKTKAVLIDWHLTSDLHNAQVHPSLPLDDVKDVPTLLIPLRNASFFLINTEVKRWRNILSGSVTGEIKPLPGTESSCPGASPRRPVWVNWCRPIRGSQARDDMEYLYLVREDGVLYYIQVALGIQASHAGEFGCHVGSAFASLGDSQSPDILAVAGDMSSGRIYTIGSWSTPLTFSERSRLDTMQLEMVETMPNWASVTDMVISSLPGKSIRSRDGIFVTSSRQPYGAITEMRQGLEARVSVFFDMDGLRSVTDLWALPLTSTGHVLLMLSSPAGTLLLEASTDAEMDSIEEVEEGSLALDATHQTLAASFTSNGKLVQVTTKSINVTVGVSSNFEDTASLGMRRDSVVLAAAIDVGHSIIMTAEKSGDKGDRYELVVYRLHTEDESVSGQAQIERTAPYTITSEPLCVTILEYTRVALVSTVDGSVTAFAFNEQGTPEIITKHSLPSSPDARALCDNMVAIRPKPPHLDPTYAGLLVCGLRDGRLYIVVHDFQNDLYFGDGLFVEFSQTAVKLSQCSDDRSIAYAMSGTDICLLAWEGWLPSALVIQNIWTSDKDRPELAQGPIATCNTMPEAHLLSSPALAGSLIMISGDEFQLSTLERSPSSVPRQIAVSGTPNRLLYAEQQRCLVCASLRYDTRAFPSTSPHSKPEERRQTWPVIDFVPSRGSEPSFSYDMQPGERVYALLEWSFKLNEEKTYSFTLVGGSYFRSGGSQRGRILFLQPIFKNWDIVDVQQGRKMSFDDPVYALALLDDITVVACVGQNVLVYRFSVVEKNWEMICAPLKLASPGIHVWAQDTFVTVSTAEDSFVSLHFDISSNDESKGSGFDFSLKPVAMAPRADTLLNHLMLTGPFAEPPQEDGMALVSTKYGQVLGLLSHALEGVPAISQPTELLFEAQLPRSLTRLKQGNIRPRWKPTLPSGVLYNNIVGCAADGSLVGLAVLEESLWRRLSWLQRLCEWSEKISPHSHQYPAYSVSELMYARNERGMPIGLSRDSAGEIVMTTGRSKLRDGHLDGDVIARVLQKGGVGMLREMVRGAAQRDDRAGHWVREHLDQELEAVDGIIEILKRLLDSWI